MKDKNQEHVRSIKASPKVAISVCSVILVMCSGIMLYAISVGIINTESTVAPWISWNKEGYGTHVGGAPDSPPNWTATRALILSKVKTKPSTENTSCYFGYVDDAPSFAHTSTRTTPTAETETWQGYWMSSDFVSDIRTQENYHRLTYSSFCHGVWGSLESYISTYKSRECNTASEAETLAKSDIEVAFTVVQGFRASYAVDKEINHSFSYNTHTSTNGAAVVIPHGAHWRQDALAAVNNYELTFTKGSPESECCPP